MMTERSFLGYTLLLCALCVGFGMLLQNSCNKPTRAGKPDTVVRIIERPVTIRDSVHTKSVLIKHRDTTYFIDKPVEIPCGDTSFVAQSDSVITNTRDTINMAFSYANRKGYFSLVFKPRPDSVITVQMPIVQTETKTEWAWLLGLFGLGLGIGSYATK